MNIADGKRPDECEDAACRCHKAAAKFDACRNSPGFGRFSCFMPGMIVPTNTIVQAKKEPTIKDRLVEIKKELRVLAGYAIDDSSVKAEYATQLLHMHGIIGSLLFDGRSDGPYDARRDFLDRPADDVTAKSNL